MRGLVVPPLRDHATPRPRNPETSQPRVAPPLLSLFARRLAVNWFNLSILGWIILIAALAIAAYIKHMPMIWIAVLALALLGIGIIVSVGKSKPQV